MRVPLTVLAIWFTLFSASKAEITPKAVAEVFLSPVSWGTSSPGEMEETSQKVLENFEKIKDASPDVVRNGVVIAMNKADTPGISEARVWGNIYAFYRFYFVVEVLPEGLVVPMFGGFGIPREVFMDMPRRMLWPLEKDDAGNLKLTYPSSTFNGPPYQALDEFNFFVKHFPLRYNSAKAGR